MNNMKKILLITIILFSVVGLFFYLSPDENKIEKINLSETIFVNLLVKELEPNIYLVASEFVTYPEKSEYIDLSDCVYDVKINPEITRLSELEKDSKYTIDVIESYVLDYTPEGKKYIILQYPTNQKIDVGDLQFYAIMQEESYELDIGFIATLD